MAQLPLFDAIYLGGVLVAFGVFAISLMSVWIATNLPDRKAVQVRAAQEPLVGKARHF